MISNAMKEFCDVLRAVGGSTNISFDPIHQDRVKLAPTRYGMSQVVGGTYDDKVVGFVVYAVLPNGATVSASLLFRDDAKTAMKEVYDALHEAGGKTND